jgi:GDP-L-fucose synthase
MGILVTGGSGFLGRAVLQELKNAIAPTHDMLNLLDQRAVLDYFEEKRPEIVIMLAGTVGGIGYNSTNPGTIAYENMTMGINTIEAARKCGVKHIVNVASVCGYPKYCEPPFKETDIGSGLPEETNRAYGLCKNYLVELLLAYKQEYGINCSNLYPSNLVGYGDNFNSKTSHVIPAIIKKFHFAKEKVTLFGDGTPTRAFLSVRDCARAIKMSIDWDYSGPVNLGPENDISIKDLAYKIRDLMGLHKIVIEWNGELNGQPKRLLDISLAKSLGWSPRESLDAMLMAEVMTHDEIVLLSSVGKY